MTRAPFARVALAVIFVVTALALTLVASRTGDHSSHQAATSAPSGGAGQQVSDSSSTLRVGLFLLLTGGWATAFIIGIWRRWRITEHERSPGEPTSTPPDYDNVSESG